MSDPFRASPVTITIDGEPIGVIEAEITIRETMADGSKRALPGTCPECARLPLLGAVVCPHGIALP